jgi:RNA polymerase sigma-70 factor (ECF subfamily)
MKTTPIDRELAALRPALLRFALLQLRNEALAEDAVQDTLIAVLEKPAQFAGHSSLRTYMTGILKHKIIDMLRAGKREVRIEADEGESEADVIDSLFRPDGHTVDMPRQWGDPDATLEQMDFFRMMREWLELDTAEICKELNISTSNAWVMLYRARVQLRECLDLNWFGRRG